MFHPALSPHPLTRTALDFAPRALWLIPVAGVVAGIAVFVPNLIAAAALFTVAATLVTLALLLFALSLHHARAQTGLNDQLAAFLTHDASPTFQTDADGEVGYQNRAAVERFGARAGQSLARPLAEVFANPPAVMHRLKVRAESLGAAREDLVTRRGHVRLSVHRIGDGGFLWRLEDMAERAIGGRGAETISLPMLTVSKTGTVLFMNEALRRLVGERVRTLDRVFRDLPLRPGEEHEVIGAEGPVRALVAEIEGSGGRREVYLLPSPAGPGRIATADPTALETLPVALVHLDGTGTITAANRAARALLPRAQAGGSLTELVEGLGRPVRDWLTDAASGRADGRPEMLKVSGAAEDAFLQVTLARTVGAAGPSLIAILSDATQFKSLEAQFTQSQKMQAIGQLAGGVAHDFNNLLTAISGHCDLLLLRHDRTDPDHADLMQISQNANRAASLVGQLLAFSRKQTLDPRVIDLRETLSDLSHLLNRLVGEKVQLSVAHDPALRTIRADKRQLEQVLMNLVVNARDAMPAGGQIRIETENLTLAEPLRRDRATVGPGDYAVIRVRDEGTGISAENLPKIFEPFFTTKRQGEGTGLGLSTVYGIVKQTGGYIFCDSAPGAGATFTLYFPTASAEAAAEPPVRSEPAARPPSRGDGVVLLVEDEAPVRAFASRALRLRGFTVIEAESAEEALKTLADDSLNVDVFVTDVIMPGMDGPSWVREALKQRPETRVIFVSGYAEESFQDRRAQVPNSVFLPKPFSLSDLTATVQGQLQ